MFICKNKKCVYLQPKKLGLFVKLKSWFLSRSGDLLLWELEDIGMCRGSGGRGEKGVISLSVCPPNGTAIHSPSALSGLRSGGRGGHRGPAPSPSPGDAQALSPLPPSHRSSAGIFWGRETAQKMPPNSPRVDSPPADAFSSPLGPLQSPTPAVLAGMGEPFSLQRKPGGGV